MTNKLVKIAVACEATAAPALAALLLVPAAVLVALYPLNWILGTISFYTASVTLTPLKFLLGSRLN